MTHRKTTPNTVLYNRQRGVALITALLIAALASVAAVAMASRQAYDIRRTGNLLHSDQAYLYALGAETWAKQIIKSDQDPNVDGAKDEWLNQQLPPTDFNGATITGIIKDMSARFPLNNVIDGEEGKAQPEYVAMLQRLCEIELGLKYRDFANMVKDWVDNDELSSAGGAEDAEYLGLDKPFRTANQPISSLSELRMIFELAYPDEKIRFEEMNKINSKSDGAYFNALPPGTEININTASSAVLQSLHSQATPEVIAEIVEKRKEEPFSDVNKFLDEIEAGIEDKKEKKQFKETISKIKLSVGSKYFELQAQVSLEGSEVHLISILKRDGDKIVTVRRGIGVL